MPLKRGQKKIIIAVSEKQRSAVHSLSEKRGFSITADYIRRLIEADAESVGIALDLSVDRGGYRGRRSAKSKE